MKIKYHEDFPKLDHRAAPSIPGRARWNERFAARPQSAPLGTGDTINWGIFKRRFWGHQQHAPAHYLRGYLVPGAIIGAGAPVVIATADSGRRTHSWREYMGAVALQHIR